MNDVTSSDFAVKHERDVKPASVTDQLKLLATTLDSLDKNLVEMEEEFRARIEEMRAILLGVVK